MLHTKTVKKQKRGLNPLMCLPEGFSFVGREPFLERDDMLELIRNRSEDLAVFRDDKWHLNVKVEAVGLLYAVRTGSELHLRSCKAAPKFKLDAWQQKLSELPVGSDGVPLSIEIVFDLIADLSVMRDMLDVVSEERAAEVRESVATGELTRPGKPPCISTAHVRELEKALASALQRTEFAETAALSLHDRLDQKMRELSACRAELREVRKHAGSKFEMLSKYKLRYENALEARRNLEVRADGLMAKVRSLQARLYRQETAYRKADQA